MPNIQSYSVNSVVSPMMHKETFDHMWRVGKVLAMSPLFPENLRKGGADTAIANGVLVMNMACRLNEDPLTIAQNIYFVGGKPSWSSSYMISKANQSGRFKNPIDWTVEGENETLSVTAHAALASTGKKVEVTINMATAKAEGWTKNQKYQSMPELMLRYRTATSLIRLYCPEVMVGLPPQTDLEDGRDMRDVTPVRFEDIHQPKTEPKIEALEKVEQVSEATESELDTVSEAAKPRFDYAKIAREIRDNLDGGAPLDALQVHYADELKVMEEEDVERFKELSELFEKYKE